MSSVSNLFEWLSRGFAQWHDAMEDGNYKNAAQIAIARIDDLWICRRRANVEADNAEAIYAGKVGLNALLDIANLCIIFCEKNWVKCPAAVEAAWDLIQDARNRLSSLHLDPDFLPYCHIRIDAAADLIDHSFGKGLYASWEMEFDGYTCTVCNRDIRSCDHVPGRWYGNSQCKCVPEGGRPIAVALVENPHHVRCRIWPWHRNDAKSDGTHVVYDVCIFRIFTPEGDRTNTVVNFDTLLMRSATAASETKRTRACHPSRKNSSHGFHSFRSCRPFCF